MITHLQPNILENKVKWALGSITTNKAGATGLEKAVFIPIPLKGNPKNVQTPQITLISHTFKVILNILQARLQQYVNCELQMFKLDLEKAEETGIKFPTSVGSSKKKKKASSRKTSASPSLTILKALTVWITSNCGNFFKSWEYQPPDLPSEKSVFMSKSNS